MTRLQWNMNVFKISQDYIALITPSYQCEKNIKHLQILKFHVFILSDTSVPFKLFASPPQEWYQPHKQDREVDILLFVELVSMNCRSTLELSRGHNSVSKCFMGVGNTMFQKSQQ